MHYEIEVRPGPDNEYFQIYTETIEAPTSQDALERAQRRNPGCHLTLCRSWNKVSDIGNTSRNPMQIAENKAISNELELHEINVIRKGSESFRKLWKGGNEKAEYEGREPLTHEEMVLLIGDPLRPFDSQAMWERKRVSGKVIIECPNCNTSLRIADGCRGEIECSVCEMSFYTDTTEEPLDELVPTSSREQGSRSDCFIATAAYGTTENKSVEILRRWRDQTLTANKVGRFVINVYYFVSPPIARQLGKSSMARRFTRWILKPLILAIEKKYGEK